ncbi:oligosaccharide flippase family protein [Paenibacillus alkaliterrae]|uniref:oligosaccharide flippase family protein n=1 Tax=Paenibacillus alkaliterrae TaxID=320909 RepID=UPI001F47C2BC|nr:oligosaccharide flippase family protein [Paenibacillus alkaliterrae]MCF2939760.1 oligosaccharide flippase family protein [Paenibacillus alkaliterrae]
MGTKKRIIENMISLFVLQGANYLLPLITLPYLVRVLGSEKFGLLAFGSAFIYYFVVITEYGFNLTATRKIAIHRDDKQKVSEIFSTIMFIKVFLTLITFVIMAAMVLIIPKLRLEWELYFALFLTVLGNVMFPVWFFQGMEKMKYITILNIVAKIITTIAIFIFIQKQSDYLLAAFIQSLGFVIAGLLSLCVIWRQFSIRLSRPAYWSSIANELKEGGQVFIATLSGVVYGQGTVLITGFIAGQSAAGYYAIAQKVASAIVGLVQPVTQAIYPYLCKLISNDLSKYINFKKRILFYGLATGVVLGIILVYSSDWVVKLITGEISPELIMLLKIYSLVILFTMMNVLLNPFVLSMEKFNAMQKMYIITAILFLVVSIPATMWLNTYGMVISILIIEVYVFINSLRITKVDIKWQRSQ